MTDRWIRLIERVAAGYAGIAARSRLREISEVDRDLRLVVTAADLVAADVMALTLAAPSGEDLPSWHPGAHLDLVLPSGRLRQYSLCGDPAERATYRIAVRRLDAGGGGSLEVHGLGVGAEVLVRGPRNAFPFAYPHLARHDIREVAFVAGGIGITALLPMVRAAAASTIPWSLTYVGRDDASMPFRDELAALPGGAVRILHGVPTMTEVLTGVDERTSVYFCGPPPFLDTIRAALDVHPHAGFHFERFAPPPILGGSPFTVRLQRAGIDVEVPADRSALAAIRDVVPDVPYSCQQGFCGTCRVGLVSGAVNRRGSAAFLASPDTMLICVDRADDRADDRANDSVLTIDL